MIDEVQPSNGLTNETDRISKDIVVKNDDEDSWLYDSM